MPVAISDQQLAAMKDISGIGMHQAADALSQLMGQGINLHVPQTHLVSAPGVDALFPHTGQSVIGLQLRIVGGACGHILIIFSHENALKILATLLNTKYSGLDELSELERSTLKEVGNILASAYLNALGASMNMPLLPSVPVLTCATAEALIDAAVSEGDYGEDQILIVETRFSVKNENISGHLIILPDPASLRVILRTLAPP